MMNDQQRQQLVEQYEEAALSLLMNDYANEEGIRLAKEFDEAQANGTLPEIPAYLDEKCIALIDKSFAKMERKARLKRISKSVVKAAVILFVLLGVMTTTVISVEAIRTPVLNFFIECHDKFTSLMYESKADNKQIVKENVFSTIYALVPEEYALVYQDIHDDDTGIICFENEIKNRITLNVYLSTGEINVDTEDAVQEYKTVSDYEVLFINKDGFKVIWSNPDNMMTYCVFANGLELDDFWKMVYVLVE